MLRKSWVETRAAVDWPESGGYSPLERSILAARGIHDAVEAERFLGASVAEPTDPFLLSDMQAGVDRLRRAKAAGETVVVYGDYDADGVCATALLYEVLRQQGLQVRWYIPDRFEEGYGLNPAAIAQLHATGARLLVSVDCGVRSINAAEAASQVGLDLVITDHHLPGDRLPQASAVINPHRPSDRYPFKGLSGVGVAYKLAQALTHSFGGGSPEGFLDLVALGTVADLAPLRGENRSMVQAGLRLLNASPRPGLQALAQQAGLASGRINATSIGFSLGPRLNAAGRMASAEHGVALLLAGPGAEAAARAERLDRLNRERQRLTSEMLGRARQRLQASPPTTPLIAVGGRDFHEGVVGLVAGRLADELYRPALVASLQADSIRGSARSIPEFHITRALDECADLLERFGGHAAAAGFGLAASNWDAFLERMQSIAQRELGGRDLRPSLGIDARVEFAQLGESLMAFIDRLEPCGEANPYPVLSTRNVGVLSKRAVGSDQNHLKLSLRQGGQVYDAIGFRLGDRLAEVTPTIDIAYRLERNEFRGVVSLQLVLEDFRPS